MSVTKLFEKNSKKADASAESTDAGLLRGLSGTEQDFEKLVLLTEKQVYSLAFSILRQRDDAEDAVQEAYLKIWKNRDTYRGDGSPIGWILRIAGNCALDMRRKRTLRTVSPLVLSDTDGEESVIDVPDDDPASNPADAAVIAEDAKTTAELIRSLPEQYRTVLILREEEGLSYMEISQRTGVPMGTVKSRIARARDILGNLLRQRNIL